MKIKILKSSVAVFSLAALCCVHVYADGEAPKNPNSYYKTTNAPLLYGAVNIVIPKDAEFDVNNSMYRVFAKDFEDGDLTSKIEIEGEELVDTSIPGDYAISYTVTDSHQNETTLTVPVSVKEETNIKVQRKIYANLKNEAANAVGMSRGDYHDRQHLGLNLFNGSQVKVTYIKGNTAVTIQNETQRHDNQPVTSKQINAGQTIELTSAYNATPFVKTPVGNNYEPTILELEILDKGVTKPLALFYKGDNQDEFVASWRKNGGYGVLESESVTVLVGYGEIDNIINSTVPNMEKDFNKLLIWWDQVIDFFDEAVGLEINPENLWDQNVRSKYYVAGHKGAGGSAYYGVSQVGISNGYTASFFQYNWGGLHEVGHGYQGSLKNGIALGEVSNNILGWFTEYYAMYTERFGEQKQFYGGLRNGTLDTKEESVHASGKTWQNSDLNDQLYIMINLLDSFEAEETWGKINSWYREHKATSTPNYDVFATVFAEEYGVNIIPYFDAFSIPVSENVRIQLFESELPLVQLAKDVVGDQTSELKSQGVLNYDYKIVKNDEIAALNLSGNLTVHLIIDDASLVEGEVGILYDGHKEVARAQVKNAVIEFANVPVGAYRVVMPQPKAAYSSDYAYTTVTTQENVMNYKYTKLEGSNYDNRMWLGITGIHDTYGIKIINNGDGTITVTPGGAKLANTNVGKTAEVTIFDNQNQVLYTTIAEDSYYFDKYNAKSSKIEVTDGCKIVVYHVSASSRVKVRSTLTNAIINELTPKGTTTTYEIMENGFKLEDMSDEDHQSIEYNLVKGVATKQIESYLGKVTQEELEQKHKNIVEKSNVLSAILSLKEEDRTSEYLSLYNKIINGGDDGIEPEDTPPVVDTTEEEISEGETTTTETPLPVVAETPELPVDNPDEEISEEETTTTETPLPLLPETPELPVDTPEEEISEGETTTTDTSTPETSVSVTLISETSVPAVSVTPKAQVDDRKEKDDIPAVDQESQEDVKNETSEVFPFIDVDVIEGNWKYESVKHVYENGIMNGIDTNLFGPERSLTRSMFATVLHRMADAPITAYNNKFSDVVAGKWYSEAIVWANQADIVNGYSAERYGVDANITREQIAKMLYKYAEMKGYDVSGKADLNGFTDKDNISGWAIDYMSWAIADGVINGKPNGDGSYRLDPTGEASRAECAAMITRFMKKYQ